MTSDYRPAFPQKRKHFQKEVFVVLVNVDFAVFVEPAVEKTDYEASTNVVSKPWEEEIRKDTCKTHAMDRSSISKESQWEGYEVCDNVLKS